LRHFFENKNLLSKEMSGSGSQFPLATYSPGLSGYAPADFQDATETLPPEIQLDPTSTGTFVPYSQLVANVSNRQLQEVKEKTVSPVTNGAAWKKRVKEFMLNKNEELLGFLRKPLSGHHTLSQADAFLRKFGSSNFSPTHHSLRDVFLDVSGVSMISRIEDELQAIGPASSVKLVEEVRWLFDKYREAGEQVFKTEAALRLKLDLLDKMYQKAFGLMDLPINEQSGVFQEAALSYLSSFFKEQNLEEIYNEYIESYRRFIALREMIITFRFTDNIDKEPLCCICLNEPVSFCVSPCGHTFCSSCSKRQMTNCYMCRTSIKERVRIFFG
jgi:hypothetical protein